MKLLKSKYEMKPNEYRSLYICIFSEPYDNALSIYKEKYKISASNLDTLLLTMTCFWLDINS